MSNVDQSEWYLAQFIIEFLVEGDTENVVHVNSVLVRAESPEACYSKALHHGLGGNSQYFNPNGRRVTSRFRGFYDIRRISRQLEDGTAWACCRTETISEEQIQSAICPKESLSAFER